MCASTLFPPFAFLTELLFPEIPLIILTICLICILLSIAEIFGVFKSTERQKKGLLKKKVQLSTSRDAGVGLLLENTSGT